MIPVPTPVTPPANRRHRTEKQARIKREMSAKKSQFPAMKDNYTHTINQLML